MKYQALYTINKVSDGKAKVKFTKGDVLTQAKFNALSENDKSYFEPIDLDALIAEVQGKVESKEQVEQDNTVDYSQFSNVLPEWAEKFPG